MSPLFCNGLFPEGSGGGFFFFFLARIDGSWFGASLLLFACDAAAESDLPLAKSLLSREGEGERSAAAGLLSELISRDGVTGRGLGFFLVGSPLKLEL